MKAAIIVDSTAGLSQETRQHPDVYEIDLTIQFMDGEIMKDTTDLEANQNFYKKMKSYEQLPTTSQPQIGIYYELMETLIQKGYDTVYAIHLSSGISGTYQSALLVAQEYADRINSYVIDTKSASIVMHELVIRALDMLSDTDNINRDYIYDVLVWTAKNSYLEFMVEDLFNLTKGGRLSSTGAIVGSMLKIRPILTFDQEGKLGVCHKIRTTKKVYQHFQSLIEEALIQHPQGFNVRIAHTNALEQAQILKQVIDDTTQGKVTCRIDVLTPVLGTHTGEGLVGLGIMPHLPHH